MSSYLKSIIGLIPFFPFFVRFVVMLLNQKYDSFLANLFYMVSVYNRCIFTISWLAISGKNCKPVETDCLKEEGVSCIWWHS
jgi:hypothetical protein